VQQGHKMIDN